MSHDTLATTIALAAAMGLGGLLLGLAYFACLRRSVALLASDAGWARPVLLTLARLAAAAAAFAFAARWGGAVPLLAGFAGFLIARSVTLRQARSAI